MLEHKKIKTYFFVLIRKALGRNCKRVLQDELIHQESFRLATQRDQRVQIGSDTFFGAKALDHLSFTGHFRIEEKITLLKITFDCTIVHTESIQDLTTF